MAPWTRLWKNVGATKERLWNLFNQLCLCCVFSGRRAGSLENSWAHMTENPLLHGTVHCRKAPSEIQILQIKIVAREIPECVCDCTLPCVCVQ